MARKPKVVPFVTPEGTPVDITEADTIKVYIGGAGQRLANVKAGARGVQAHLNADLPMQAKAIAKALGKGWVETTSPGAKYLKFTHN